MSVTGKIWRGTLFVTAATLLSKVAVFLGNVIMIRLLGKDLVGQLGLVDSWLSLATMFALVGIATILTKQIAHYLESDRTRVGNLVGSALLLGMILSLIVGLVVYVASLKGFLDFIGISHSLLSTHALLIVLLLVMSAMRTILTGMIYGLQSFGSLVTSSVLVGVLSLPLSYLLVKSYGFGGALGTRLILAVVESGALLYLVIANLKKRGILLSFRRLPKDASELLSLGLPIFVGQLVANPVQPIMLSFLAAQPGGLGQVALFTAANRLSSFTSFLPSSMATTLIPVLSGEWARGDRERFREGALVALRMFWLSTMPLTLFLIAASPLLLGWLYGDMYIDAWPVAIILLTITLVASINETADRSLTASGRIWLSTGNNLLWTVLFIACAVWLIPTYLSVGYGLAFLLSFIVYVCWQLWWLVRLYAVQLQKLGPLLLLSLPFLFAAVAIAASQRSYVQLAMASLLCALSLLLSWRLLLAPLERSAIMLRARRISRILPNRNASS
jgi:O-antigen/teichoic acid export membrane protein